MVSSQRTYKDRVLDCLSPCFYSFEYARCMFPPTPILPTGQLLPAKDCLLYWFAWDPLSQPKKHRCPCVPWKSAGLGIDSTGAAFSVCAPPAHPATLVVTIKSNLCPTPSPPPVFLSQLTPIVAGLWSLAGVWVTVWRQQKGLLTISVDNPLVRK